MACIRRESPEVLLVDETCIVDGANDSMARLEKEKKKKRPRHDSHEACQSRVLVRKSKTSRQLRNQGYYYKWFIHVTFLIIIHDDVTVQFVDDHDRIWISIQWFWDPFQHLNFNAPKDVMCNTLLLCKLVHLTVTSAKCQNRFRVFAGFHQVFTSSQASWNSET